MHPMIYFDYYTLIKTHLENAKIDINKKIILMIIFNRIDKNFNDGNMGLSCLLSFISIFVSWFLMLKLFTDNGIGTIIFVMIILFL